MSKKSFILQGPLAAQTPGADVIGPLEMNANGAGPIIGHFGYLENGNDPLNTPNSPLGSHNVDWHRYPWFSTDSFPHGGPQSTNDLLFFLSARPNCSGTDHFCMQFDWLRNDNYVRAAGNSYEIRFTDNGTTNWAIDAFIYGYPIPVPFEIWYLGNTPNDPSDDVRMIPWIADYSWLNIDGEYTGEFEFQLDHEASGAENDPFSDYIYFRMPEDDSPGDSGYQQFVTDMFNDSYNFDGSEHLSRLTIFSWNGTSRDPDPNIAPETGTVFRISIAKLVNINYDFFPNDLKVVNCDNPDNLIPSVIYANADFNVSATDIDTNTILISENGISENGPVTPFNIDTSTDYNGDGNPDLYFEFKVGELGSCPGSPLDLRIDAQTTEGEKLSGEGKNIVVLLESNAEPDICHDYFGGPGEFLPFTHTNNNVEFRVQPYGNLFNGSDGLYYKCQPYVFAGGLMLGGIQDGEIKVAQTTYDGSDEDFTGSQIGSSAETFNETFPFNSKLPDNVANWPIEFSKKLYGYTIPQIVLPKVAENIVTEFNDSLSSNPLGVEIKQRTLAFNYPESDYRSYRNDMIFYIWDIKNTSEQTISDVYAGGFFDADVAYYADNISNVLDGMSITFDSGFDNTDFFTQSKAGTVKRPSIVGFHILDKPRYSETKNAIFEGSNDPSCGGASSPEEVYNQLQGLNRDGSNRNDGQCDYLLVDTQDQRFITSAGPFTLRPGETKCIVGVLILGDFEQDTEAYLQVEYYSPLLLDGTPYVDPNDPAFKDIRYKQVMAELYYRLFLKFLLPEVEKSSYSWYW